MIKVPELRFDGFDGEWKEHNLSEFISVYRGLTYSPKDITNNISDTFVIRSSNVKNNSIIDADNVYVNPSIVNTENVKNGDIILVVRNGSRSLIGKHAAITKDIPNTVIGAFMLGVRARTPDFINALFDTTKFDKNIRKNLGATINQITNKNISEMKFFFTDIEEQEKIGVLFKKLDALIEVQEGKVSKLEDFKKSMLQKMYPKKGKLVPEFRFDGFDGDWEKVKIKEIYRKAGSGGTPKSSISDFYNGDIPFLSISDITNSNGKIRNTEKNITKLGLDNSSARLVPAGSISLAMYASVGKVAKIEIELATSQAFFNMIPSEYYDTEFLYQTFKKMELFNQWRSEITTGTQPNLNANIINNFKLEIPSLE
ncbi:MAG: restriction endonuclease subunit S, partial [Anaerococcus hydrogenalis]|nr:restriction endonuclease subunit S [Anaerococcus hydrogenalis]